MTPGAQAFKGKTGEGKDTKGLILKFQKLQEQLPGT
jgi:hypothetical protein